MVRFKRYDGWFQCLRCLVETDFGWIKRELIKVKGKSAEKVKILCDKCYNRSKKNVVKNS